MLNIHDGIFVPVFGDRTLSFRKAPRRGEHRDDDGVEYPIWVVQGSGLSPSIVTKRGARASQVERRVREVCAAFERAAPEAVDDVALGAELITRLYVRLNRVHPFGDGNGRTAWTAMQYAAGRVHFPLVQSTPTREARLALGDAIRNGREIHRLVKHVRDAAWAQ